MGATCMTCMLPHMRTQLRTCMRMCHAWLPFRAFERLAAAPGRAHHHLDIQWCHRINQLLRISEVNAVWLTVDRRLRPAGEPALALAGLKSSAFGGPC